MKQPNNLRNRWRRMRDAFAAYGFVGATNFRRCAKYMQANPLSYAAEPHHVNVQVNLKGSRGGK